MKCPVCIRQVNTNKGGVNLAYHRDKVGRPCPASGQPKHITEEQMQ
jgi:hypothetical protein